MKIRIKRNTHHKTGRTYMEKILFVDDDVALLEVHQAYFIKAGYDVDTCADATTALQLLKTNDYRIVILDIQMDCMNGMELCYFIRRQSDVPIIFLTNLSEEEALVKSFACGGDDFITKPYFMKGLEARIRARIQNKSTSLPITTSMIQINEEKKQAYINETSLLLTSNEYEILLFLIQHKGIAFTQEEIYRAIWGGKFYNTHSIQVLIMRIRKKIQSINPELELIKTQWGKGYVYTE